MTYTPEKVAELIEEAREMDAGVLVTKYDREAQAFIKEPSIVARLADALAEVTAERDQAKAELADAFRTDIPSLRDQRDAALVVIREIRTMLPRPLSEPLSRDFSGRPFPRFLDGDRVASILSRIPEHPTNTEGQAE